MPVETVASVAKALVPIFRDGSSFARATALDLLSILYSKHSKMTSLLSDSLRNDTQSPFTGKTNPELIHFAVPEIVALALDDKDDIGASRTTAISLLAVTLAGYLKPELAVWDTRETILKHVTSQAMKFTTLLKNESLRTSAVKLISVLAIDPRSIFHYWFMHLPYLLIFFGTF